MKYKEKTLFIIFAIICITLFLLLFNNKKSQNKESENNEINAKMMFQTGDFNYAETRDIQIIEL